MKIIVTSTATILLFLSTVAYAGIFEKPVHTKFKDTPIEENIVLAYVQFGTLPNGANAIQAIGPKKVRYYSRNALLASGAVMLSVNELDCESGAWQIVGAGNFERSTAFRDPPRGGNVRDMNPRDLPVYREVCTSAGIDPSW